MSLNLSLTIQSLIFHMSAMFENCSLHSSWENYDTNIYPEKTEKWTKRKNKSRKPDSESHDALIIVHTYIKFQGSSFIEKKKQNGKMENNRNIGAKNVSLSSPFLKIVACTNHEKTMTQICPKKTEKIDKAKEKSNEPDSQSMIQ